MKVIICGAGQVGWQIARHLSGERNDVTVVDNNPDLVRRATDTLDVQGIAGFASHPDVLDRAGARGLVSESDSRLSHFTAVAEQDGAPLFGFCPAAIADLAAHIDAGCASLRKDA